MSSHIDFRTLPANVPVLCIPRVYPNISEARIRRIFEDLDMGTLERIDIVSKHSDKGERFNRVFVHFRRWNDSSNSREARERLLNGKEIKIIYDDPWFWKISAYREVERRPEIAPRLDQHRGEPKKATLRFDDADSPRKPRPDERPRQRPDERPRQKPRNENKYRPKKEERLRPKSPTCPPPPKPEQAQEKPRPVSPTCPPPQSITKVNYGEAKPPVQRKIQVSNKQIKIEEEEEEGEIVEK